MSKLKIPTFMMVMLLMIPFMGCNKYPDGPSISLRSRTARLTNTWRVEVYLKNGNDMAHSYGGYTETYTSTNDYYYTWDNSSGSGKWNFQNHDMEIRINGINNQPSQTLYILRLEEKSLWYYYFDGNDRKEFHMIPA